MGYPILSTSRNYAWLPPEHRDLLARFEQERWVLWFMDKAGRYSRKRQAGSLQDLGYVLNRHYNITRLDVEYLFWEMIHSAPYEGDGEIKENMLYLPEVHSFSSLLECDPNRSVTRVRWGGCFRTEVILPSRFRDGAYHTSQVFLIFALIGRVSYSSFFEFLSASRLLQKHEQAWRALTWRG